MLALFLFTSIAHADVILHVPRALTDADRAELAARGLTIRHALPGGRYLARGFATDAQIEPLTAEKKIHPSAWREAANARGLAELNVIFHRDVPFDEARAAILAAGGSMDIFASRFIPSRRIEARVPPTALEALASDERVLAVAGPRRFRIATENATTATLSHVKDVHAAHRLTGAGVAVSLFELAEAQTSHVEFGGRLQLAPTTIGGTLGDRRHATHVAGTIGASGVRADARGMAPGVTIHQFCVRDHPSNACEGNWLTLKDERLAPLGVIVDNNSWGWILGWQDGAQPVWNAGDAYWGAYDLLYSAPLDEISNERGILFVHSAGNDGSLPPSLRLDPWQMHYHVDDNGDEIPGQRFCVSRNGSGSDCVSFCNAGCEVTPHHPQTPFDTIGATASAKNVISVGAIDSSFNPASFSSRGPAKDGRVKPEVVARGVGVLSSIPSNGYGTSSGTSMSAPAVTGIAALLAEQWHRSHPGTNPTPAQLKALLIAGTDDLGNPGPDYTYGFGLVNAKASVDLILNDRIRTLSLAQGATHESLVVVDQPQNVRVVLNWPDPAIPFLGGDDVAAKSLINDLDLKIIDPAGNTILPWTLNKDQVSANATRGVNGVDVTEMVEIANATPGVYRVIATGTNVMEGPQTAVLVTNVRYARPCTDVQERDGAYGNLVSGQLVAAGLCAPGDVDLYKFDVTASGTVTVTITTGDTPLRATLLGTQAIPAFSSATLTANVEPGPMTLKIEAAGALGVEPQYSFTPTFPETHKPKRRSAR
ncbi:MAG TPA: S8 family serine peptidase [Thermoanaerobaculia bacterium]|nr:S8 family serine peptidase [Thermoanaerobaculia bacterium]